MHACAQVGPFVALRQLVAESRFGRFTLLAAEMHAHTYGGIVKTASTRGNMVGRRVRVGEEEEEDEG